MRAANSRNLRSWLLDVILVMVFGLRVETHASTNTRSITVLDPTQVAREFSQRSWQKKDGLPDNQVQALLQTRDGFLWIGTSRGLARFDGVKFTVFDHLNTPEMVDDNCRSLAEDTEGNIWVATDDRAYFARLLAVAKERPDWSVLMGPESLMVEAVQNGAQGGVNGGANVWPQLLVQLYQAASSGDAAALARLQPQLATLDGIYRVGRHASAVIKGMKCSLSLLGICSDFMAEPFVRFREPERRQVQAVLRNCGL